MELPVARLAYIYVDAHRDHKKTQKPDFNEFLFFKPVEQVKQVPTIIANTVYSVLQARKIPNWLFYSLPRREIFANRHGAQIVYPRLWLDAEGDSIALFCPRRTNKSVSVEVAVLMDGVVGPRLVKDVDTNEVFLIDIPPRDEPDVCIYELTIKIP